MSNILKTILLLAAVITSAFGFNAYFAKANELKTVEMRLDYKIESDVFNSMRERLWMLEEKCNYGTCSDAEKREFKELKDDIEMQKEKVRELQKQMFKGRA